MHRLLAALENPLERHFEGDFRGETIPQGVKHGAKRDIGLMPLLEVKLLSSVLSQMLVC
jgi:hypothetical protein